MTDRGSSPRDVANIAPDRAVGGCHSLRRSRQMMLDSGQERGGVEVIRAGATRGVEVRPGPVARVLRHRGIEPACSAPVAVLVVVGQEAGQDVERRNGSGGAGAANVAVGAEGRADGAA